MICVQNLMLFEELAQVRIRTVKRIQGLSEVDIRACT